MIPIYVTHKKFRRHRNDNKILFKIFSTETVWPKSDEMVSQFSLPT